MIIRFKPVYQNYVWGGSKFAKAILRSDAPEKTAESWEIADRPEGMSVAVSSNYLGRTLASLVDQMGEKLIGKGRDASRFPLLVKILDAAEPLSVQVHPDDETAALMGSEAKAEAWVALEDSSVLAGIRPGLMSDVVSQMDRLCLKRGEALYIPGGTVHAICGGSLLLEVQQNSNTTYRLFDWGRNRPLQVEEALRAMKFQPASFQPIRCIGTKGVSEHLRLIESPYFVVERIVGECSLSVDPRSFQIFFCEAGEGEIISSGCVEEMRRGDTVLVPACAKSVQLEGRMRVIRIFLPH